MIKARLTTVLEKRHSGDQSGFYWIAAVVFAGSVVGTAYLSRSMRGGMNMPGRWTMSMVWMQMAGRSWLSSMAMFLLMWLTMMVAMMFPSVVTTLGRYCAARRSPRPGAIGATTLAAASYTFVWLFIGIALYAAGVALATAAMKYATVSRIMPILGAGLLVASGGMQFTSIKWRALRRCRNPSPCVVPPVSGGYRAAWQFGLRLGVSCAVSSAGLMSIMLVLGMMNLGLMAIVAVVIALEKLMPNPEWIVWGAGGTLIGVGAFMLMQSLA